MRVFVVFLGLDRDLEREGIEGPCRIGDLGELGKSSVVTVMRHRVTACSFSTKFHLWLSRVLTNSLSFVHDELIENILENIHIIPCSLRYCQCCLDARYSTNYPKRRYPLVSICMHPCFPPLLGRILVRVMGPAD